MAAYKLIREKVSIPTAAGKLKLLILRPVNRDEPRPGLLWIHGGGFATGSASMVYFSAGFLLAKRFGSVLISPEYRLSRKAPYPADFEDCCSALEYMHDHADELRIRADQLIVGGESAGGGLAAAVCLYARDRGKIPVAFQLPLYPMLDCCDTPSSADNHAFPWNTYKNHAAWKLYLGKTCLNGPVPKYASPARETDFSGLPPAYTFVCEGEPFHDETQSYIRKLQEAGVKASLDVYPGSVHAFDMLLPWSKKAIEAKRRLCEVFGQALEDGFCAEQIGQENHG